MTEWKNKTKCLTFGGSGRRAGGICGADKNVCLQLFICRGKSRCDRKDVLSS